MSHIKDIFPMLGADMGKVKVVQQTDNVTNTPLKAATRGG